VPLIDEPALRWYLEQRSFPGGTTRNFASYGHHVSELSETQKYLLCDPQTSGGLLVSVKADGLDQFVEAASSCGLERLQPIGRMIKRTDRLVFLR
jgi:selenide,water dikinase